MKYLILKKGIFFIVVFSLICFSNIGIVEQIPAATYDTDLGSAIFVPSTLNAGQFETFRLIYTIGPNGLSKGDVIKIHDPDFHGMGWTIFQRFQTTYPNESGYLTATSSRPNVKLSIDRIEEDSVNEESYTLVNIDKGSIRENETITITFGDNSVSPYGKALSPHKAYKNVTWNVYVSTDDGLRILNKSSLPRITIEPLLDPIYMFATGPTYVLRDVPFDLDVRVLDKYGNPCKNYTSRLSFSSPYGSATLPTNPDQTRFPADIGYQNYPIIFHETGIQYVFINDGLSFSINSNPIIVVDELPENQIFWGDLHGHHGYVSEEGLRRVDQYLEYARDISDLDFVCESAKSSAYWNVPTTHEEIKESIVQYEDEDFVPFYGFEWMGKKADGEGHHNVYYLAVDAPYYSPNDNDSNSLDKLYLRVAEDCKEALIIPHAPSYSGYNWYNFNNTDLNARFRKLAEIYSHWNNSEIKGDGAVRAGWALGNKMGTIACTDGHYCFPGLPISDVCDSSDPGGPDCIKGFTNVGGLTAVYTSDLTRNDLWQGLKQRHTYATDGMRIFLDFSSDGCAMGEEYQTSTPPYLEVMAAGTDLIEKIEIFRGNYCDDPTNMTNANDYFTKVYENSPMNLISNVDFIDMDFSEDCFYYVKITQVDGRRAWSSPIWVKYGPKPFDFWSKCGNGVVDPGENLVTCPCDCQIPQISELVITKDNVEIRANDVSMPLTGFYVYNVGNVESFIEYDTPEWLTFMKRMIDLTKFGGGHFIEFASFGHLLYSGPQYPNEIQMNNESNWDWKMLDKVFDYAAENGVYIIMTIGVDNPLSWWADDNPDKLQTDDEGMFEVPVKTWNTVTFHTPSWWYWADTLLECFINHYKMHPALLGWDYRVGEGENNYAPPYTADFQNPPDTWCDYSFQARDNFRAWLADKYILDIQLQESWHNSTVTLATAEIPFRLEEVNTTNLSEIISLVNSPGDNRTPFYDWIHFRFDEKIIENTHFDYLFKTIDPNHILLSDPAYAPLRLTDIRNGRMDGEAIYRSPYIDALIQHPRISNVDEGSFNTPRFQLFLTEQYATHNKKITTWAQEETSEVVADGDQENIWKLDSIASLFASMGQGNGLVIGSTTDPELPAWSVSEVSEFRRLSGIFTSPELKVQKQKIAVLADPMEEGYYYFINSPLASNYLRETDRLDFLNNIWNHGLTFDIITVGDVLVNPSSLTEYDSVFVIHQPRIPVEVARILSDYRDRGGGLFICGQTGIYSEQGELNTTSLEILLGVPVEGLQINDVSVWSFLDTTDPLLGSLKNKIYADDNAYYIPRLDLAGSGFTVLGRLSENIDIATVGYKDKTVFWLPMTQTDFSDCLTIFQNNIYDFYGVSPKVISLNEVESTGENYINVFSSEKQVLHINYPNNLAGAIVWDWISMKNMGIVPTGPNPQFIFNIEQNQTAFLSTIIPENKPKLVSISGASLTKAEFFPKMKPGAGEKGRSPAFVVALYRAVPGLQVQVAIHPGRFDVKETVISGGGLDYSDFDGSVYVIHTTPTCELLTITLELK